MRQYRYEATEETIEALRLLRGAWAGIRIEPRRVTVRLADAREVRLEVESADAEPAFEAVRIRAALHPENGTTSGLARSAAAPYREAADFAIGRNDVVLFSGATWLEASRGVEHPEVQFSGHPGQISERAVAVCLTTDAVVIATPVGTGFLVRTGLQPQSVEVTDDPATLDQFLRDRGYRSSGSTT